MTIEEYLAFEETALEKHEYFNGEMYAMAGGSIAHSQVCGNAFAALHTALRGKECQAFESNLRVLVPRTGLFAYPDAMVVCEPLERVEGRTDTITNPKVIVEMLSDSTEAYDRGGKFRNYQSITSVEEYVLITQYGPTVDVFRPQADGGWLLTPASGMEAVATLHSIGCELQIADLY